MGGAIMVIGEERRYQYKKCAYKDELRGEWT